MQAETFCTTATHDRQTFAAPAPAQAVGTDSLERTLHIKSRLKLPECLVTRVRVQHKDKISFMWLLMWKETISTIVQVAKPD